MSVTWICFCDEEFGKKKKMLIHQMTCDHVECCIRRVKTKDELDAMNNLLNENAKLPQGKEPHE